MKQARYKEPLPLAVIEAARAGDAGAVEQVLQYYNGYINKLCTRTLYDDCGQLHVCVDEYMKHRLENKLIYETIPFPLPVESHKYLPHRRNASQNTLSELFL